MYIETIRRNKGAVYKVFVKHHGVVKTKSFTRKVDAHQWGLAFENSLRSGMNADVSFRQLSEIWFANHCLIRKAPSSIKADLALIAAILEVLGAHSVRELTARDVDHLVTRLRTQSLRSNKTINKHLVLTQTILNYGVRRDYLLRSPLKADHFLPEDEVGYQYWQLTEAERFVAHADSKYQEHRRFVPLLYAVALNTGMRWGEIVALKWDAILLHPDPNKSVITVRRSYCNVSKKIRETTKGHKIRYVGVNDILHSMLRKAYENRNHELDFLFHTLDGTALKISNFCQRYFFRDIKEAGAARIRFHDMRHTYASHFMMNGGNIYDLQKILGHSDLKTTLRYAHLAKEHILSKANVVRIGCRDDNVITADFTARRSTVF